MSDIRPAAPSAPAFVRSFGAGLGSFRDAFLGSRIAFSPDVEGTSGTGGNANLPAEPQTFSLDYVRELRAENKGWRLKAGEQEKLAADAKAAANKATADAKAAADKSAKDAEEKVAQASAAANQRVIRAELKAQAIKAGMVDLDGLKLLDTSAITVGEDGEVVLAADFFAKAKEAKPYLFGATGADRGTTSNPASPPKPAPATGKRAEELSETEYAAELARLTGARR